MVSFFPIISLKDIPFSDIKGLQVGNAQDDYAMGDVYEGETKISGLLSKDRDVFLSAEDAVMAVGPSGGFPGSGATNTTLAAVFTNADFEVPSLRKVAAMAANGMSRAIRPAPAAFQKATSSPTSSRTPFSRNIRFYSLFLYDTKIRT